MKIIATVGRDKFLIEADTYDIGRIMGEYSASQRTLEVGTEIPVSDLYSATRDIVDGSKELTNHADKVLKLMGALEKFGAVIGPIAAKIKEKELKDK